MDFTARLLRDGLDEAMLLFQLRRTGATATFVHPPKGGSDVQVTGTVSDEKATALLEALTGRSGALHLDGRHWLLKDGSEAASIEEAEEGLPGPWTVPGTTRADWSFGGDAMDQVVQALALHGRQDIKGLHERTGLRVEEVMRAIQSLTSNQTARRYRVPEGPEQYDIAGPVRAKLPID